MSMWGKTKKEISQNTNKDDAVRRCIKGYDCKYIAKEKLKHIVSKDAFNIDGLGKKVIEQFWELNLSKNHLIFLISIIKIIKLEGWGNFQLIILKNQSINPRKFSLDKFIFFNRIRHIGQENAKILADFF